MEKKRTKIVRFLASEQEYEAYRAAAEDSGQSVSAWIRLQLRVAERLARMKPGGIRHGGT